MAACEEVVTSVQQGALPRATAPRLSTLAYAAMQQLPSGLLVEPALLVEELLDERPIGYED